MKNIFLLLILVLSYGYSTFSQSMSKTELTYLFTRKPLIPLDSIDSYYITTKIDTIQNKFLKETFENEINRNLWMNGLKKTTNKGIEIIVNLKPHDAYKKTVQHSSDANKVTNQIFHRYAIKYEVLLPKTKQTALRWTLEPGYSSYYQEWIGSVPGLEQHYQNEITSGGMILKKEELLKNLTKALGKEIRSFLDYTRMRGEVTLKSVKKYKNYSYSDLDDAISNAKEGLDMMKVEYKEFPDDVVEKMVSGSIKLWINALREFNPNDKKSRINKKVAIAIYQNLYTIYTKMSKFDLADRYRKEAESKVKKTMDQTLIQEYEGSKKRFEANNSK